MLGKLSESFSRRLAAALKAKQMSSAVSQLETERFTHTPVMLTEVIDALNVQDGQTLIDFTFGAGGHSKALLSAAKDVKVFGVDRDPTAYRAACSIATEYPGRLFPVLSRFSEVEETLEQLGVQPNSVDGAILDCGCSSMQFDDPSRGSIHGIMKFPLNLCVKLDCLRHPSSYVIGTLLYKSSVDIKKQIQKYFSNASTAETLCGNVFESLIVLSRNERHQSWVGAGQLYIGSLGERRDMLGRPTHLATKTFMALRIFVNDELNELNHALTVGRRLLRPGGRLAVLSFHSLEDRLVKRHFQGIDLDEPVSGSIAQKYRNAATWHGREEMEVARRRVWEPIGTLGLPSAQEVERNPRSRSAKLRVAAKLP
ncbi:SAM dependent methyltransferase, putative [Ixodes scapularis]|uniref:SAM dependent methyltransferase, putative n=1 Tax=Ixodes scapularis TaxID=6945 RepID=B7PFT7_IXOSC|nr:SAM dependent methyltransferase, putative [Ixodes scapularis]|eukprot:XP_002434059.1 SAM dependent methyltransferase, putative [Ixodes scapularis]